MTSVRYEVVTMGPGGPVAAYFIGAAALTAAMVAHGFKYQGPTQSRRLRSELQGQPVFSGLCGPMWGGNAPSDANDSADFTVRYEDSAANEVFSR